MFISLLKIQTRTTFSHPQFIDKNTKIVGDAQDPINYVTNFRLNKY